MKSPGCGDSWKPRSNRAHSAFDGLIYPPGINSPTDELEALCRVVAENDRFYATHLRGDTPFKAPKLVDSLMEALSVMRNTGSRLHVSHADAKFPNNGSAEEMIELMQKARDDGFNVTCDLHPYLAAMTFLASFLPPRVFEGGAKKACRAAQIPHGTGWDRQGPRRNLQPSRCRNEMWKLTQVILPGDGSGPRRLEVLDIAKEREREARRSGRRKSCGNRRADVRSDGFAVDLYPKRIRRMTLLWPFTSIGGDGAVCSPGNNDIPMSKHPRAWGSFPKTVNEYCKKEKKFSLEETVRRMTGLSAASIGLKDRGVLKNGFKADIVVLNPDTFTEKATFEDPMQVSEGVEYVFVNGVPAIENGRRNDSLAGKVLRKG